MHVRRNTIFHRIDFNAAITVTACETDYCLVILVKPLTPLVLSTFVCVCYDNSCYKNSQLMVGQNQGAETERIADRFARQPADVWWPLRASRDCRLTAIHTYTHAAHTMHECSPSRFSSWDFNCDDRNSGI